MLQVTILYYYMQLELGLSHRGPTRPYGKCLETSTVPFIRISETQARSPTKLLNK